MRTGCLLLLGALLLALTPTPGGAEKDPLLLGDYELDRDNPVLDGDTIRCWKLNSGVRLLGVDAEETFKALEDRRDAGLDYDAYLAKKRAENDLPVKFGSFLGEEAAHFARDFFRGVKSVRLEYDSAERKKDIYGRHLCYVFATPRGGAEEKNFCIELVRAGYSPYSAKYGHSARFRKQFEAAEREARQAKRAIWNEKAMGYRDYDRRITWWNSRASQLERWAASPATQGNAVDLGADNAGERLEKLKGKPVVLLGNMPERADQLFAQEPQPRIAFTAGEKATVQVRVKDAALWKELAPEVLRGWYVVVRGTLEFVDGGYRLLVVTKEDFAKA